jgi:hypothetical protein
MELRQAAEARIQRQARAYMRLQEAKQKAVQEEQRRRQAKIYGGAPAKEKKRKGLNDLRRKFLGSDDEFEPSVAPKPIIRVSKRSALPRLPKPMGRVARSLDDSAAVLMTEPPAPPVRRSHLPILGKGKTRIPMFKQ